MLQITDATDASPPTATMTQDATTVTANISYKGSTFTLTFDKSGPMGGHITAKESDGTTCDENLGASGSTPDGGAPGSDGGPGAGDGGGGSGGSSGGSGDGGSNAANGGSSRGGGCGCTAVGDGPTNLGAVAALGLLAPRIHAPVTRCTSPALHRARTPSSRRTSRRPSSSMPLAAPSSPESLRTPLPRSASAASTRARTRPSPRASTTCKIVVDALEDVREQHVPIGRFARHEGDRRRALRELLGEDARVNVDSRRRRRPPRCAGPR